MLFYKLPYHDWCFGLAVYTHAYFFAIIQKRKNHFVPFHIPFFRILMGLASFDAVTIYNYPQNQYQQSK